MTWLTSARRAYGKKLSTRPSAQIRYTRTKVSATASSAAAVEPVGGGRGGRWVRVRARGDVAPGPPRGGPPRGGRVGHAPPADPTSSPSIVDIVLGPAH